jgi:hypothetical protein
MDIRAQKSTDGIFALRHISKWFQANYNFSQPACSQKPDVIEFEKECFIFVISTDFKPKFNISF